jgi:hypothetical protein
LTLLAGERLRAVRRADLESIVGVPPLDGDQLRERLQDRAVTPGLAQQRVHQAVRAHDAGRRRQEADDGRHFGLEPAAPFSSDERERDAVVRPAREQALELGLLLLSQGDEQLAGPPVGDTARSQSS